LNTLIFNRLLFFRKVPFLVADAAEPVIAGIAVESAPVPEKRQQ
jgi:hypothetical protein